MMSSKNPNPGQGRMFKGLHQKGDSVDNVKSPYNYPKLPNDVSLELQQKVYSSSQYYSDRTQIIKNKFDNLTLENNKQQYPKPYCPMHITTNRRPQSSPPIQPQYTINRLEESYWAKWKPNKCDSTDTWQSYSNQATCNAPCSTPCSARRPRCVTTPMMSKECLDMLSKSNRRPKPRCDKHLEVIREPADMRESNSSDVGVTKTASNKKVESKCSCCTCPSQSKSNSEEEKTSKTKTDVQTEEYDDDQNEDDEHFETSQEEYENLYNEMYMEYETQLMNRISEYEMQREQEEMYELEKQLAEAEERKRLEQEAQNDTMPHNRNPSVHNVNQIDETQNYAQNESHINTPVQQSQSSSPNETPRQTEAKNTLPMRLEEEMRPATAIEQSHNRSQEKSLGNSNERRPQSADNTDRTIERNDEQRRQLLLRNTKDAQQILSTEHNDIALENEYRKQMVKNAQDREKIKSEDEHRRTMSQDRRHSTSSERDRIELEDEHRKLRLLRNAPETQLTPHLSSSNEYSEPEIAILKHTDSFIINSRRQKEDRPRKQQPKFLKLKSSFTSPPVKGHTYPLKSALKKERPSPPPIIGFSRPISPAMPKTRSPAKSPQYMYMLRH